MSEQRRDYVAAFFIGALVGVGATMLLTPRTEKKSFVYRVRPPAGRLRKRGRKLRKVLRRRH